VNKLLACIVLLLTFSHAEAGLIFNGDFELGNTGFDTEYTFIPGNIGPAESYDVVSDPALSRPFDINPVSYGDHTTGMGLMMAVNESRTPNTLVWGQTVTVDPNTDYDFSVWLSSWFLTAPSQLDVRFNGVSVGTAMAPSTVAVWEEFSLTWNSGSSTSARIELRNLTTADIGGDFAIDDVSLLGPQVTPVPVPPTFFLALSGVGFVGCGCMRRKRRTPILA
jgi:hypothetical protein